MFNKYISQFKIDDAKKASHLSLKGGKYKIDDYNEFFKHYLKNYKNEKLYIVEKVNKENFRLFYDLDSKIINISDDIVETFLINVKTILSKELDNYNFDNKVHKSETRYHIIFKNIIVNNTTALYLNSELCKLNEIYKDIIDNSVYNTGLRLIGSYKIDKPSIYRLYDLETHQYKEIKNIQELKDSSINNLEKLNQTLNKQIVKTELKKNEIYNFPFCDKAGIKKVELNTDNIVSIEKQGDISFILLKERHCPFYNREHKRKQSYLYLIYNTKRDTCKLSCYNSECKGKSIKIKTKMDEIVESKKELIKSSLYGGHYSVAKLISEIYPSKYRVDNLKNKTWYEFNGTRWVEQSCGLHVMLSEEMPKYYFKYIDLIENMDDKTDEEIEEEKKNVYNIIKKLETTPYKKNILEELANIYYHKDSQFYKKLDSNPLLIGFENGVYDLSLFKFRQGLFNDYITFSTGYDYIETKNNDEREKIMEFLSKIITDNDIKEYLLTILGKSLSGLLDDKFFVWTGITGANGKSTLINFLEMALGDYSTSIDISLLTQKRTASSNATPDLIRLRGKRLFSLQEPEHNDVIRTGLLKQLTGGDNIIARELFKSPVSFKLQGTMLLCCNDLPTIASTDGGTWRRLRVIEFNSRFCDNPQKVNEFKIIPNVKDMLEKWKSTFMLILIDYYKKYAIDMNYVINEPLEVITSTNKYKHDNDKFSDFIEECIEESKEFTSNKDIYIKFRMWWETNYPSCKLPEIKELKRTLVSNFGREKINKYGNLKVNGFNVCFKSDNEYLDNDDDDEY